MFARGFYVTALASLLLSLFSPLSYAQPPGDGTGGGDTSGGDTGNNGSNPPPPPAGGLTSCANPQDCYNSIVQNTYQALVRIDNVPEQLKNISRTALSWIAKDDSDTTATLQGYFATLGKWINGDLDAQAQAQGQVAVDQFARGDGTLFTMPNPQNPQILQQISNLNELSFLTMLGKPPFPKAPNVNLAPQRYIENASGTFIIHEPTNFNWPGNARDQYAIPRYYNFYAATNSIESYNAYVLSQLYAENQNGNQISTTQKQLIHQATDSDWMSKTSSEDLGKVLRQLLMFQSQSYVLLTQLIQIERQLLTAQVMNNTLMILSNQSQENVLLSKAKGEQPS